MKCVEVNVTNTGVIDILASKIGKFKGQIPLTRAVVRKSN